jgi:hypothetical protein
MKKIIAGILLVLIATSVSAANTTIGQLQISPAAPTRNSTVTYSIVLTEPADEVKLWHQQCKVGLCQPAQNDTMTQNGNTYQLQVTLNYPDVTYITAKVLVKKGTTWTIGQELKTNVTAQNQSNNNTSGNTKTPGFEIIPALAAIGVVLLLIRRKRS